MITGGYGEIVELPRVACSQDNIKHVERQEAHDKASEAGHKLTLDPAGVTSLDQVPRCFQRRVSAFGVRNQQDSTFRKTFIANNRL